MEGLIVLLKTASAVSKSTLLYYCPFINNLAIIFENSYIKYFKVRINKG